MDLKKRFEDVSGEYLKFDKVENKKSKRPDLHAFLLLEELFPGESDRCIVCSAGHDEIWLDVEASHVASLTDSQIVELTRCGVIFAQEDNSLCMFV